MYKLRILSLGAGVQSTTLFLMACDGLIPKFDATIFADTGWESAHTYQLLHELKQKAEISGTKIIVVRAGDIREPLRRQSGNVFYPSMPFFLRGKNGQKGMAHRQCTAEYKSSVIVKEIRKMLGLNKYQRAEKDCVEQVIGFSLDESKRMTVARQRFSVFSFPLITDLKMDREDCKTWLAMNYPELIVKKSACIGCPYKNNNEWRSVKECPEEWKQAVEFDKQIRNYKGLILPAYLHRARVPLDEVNFEIIEKPHQLKLFQDCKDYRGIEIIKTMVETL